MRKKSLPEQSLPFCIAEVPDSVSASSGFKDSDIGPIPVEWEVVPLGKVASLNMGQSPPSATYNADGEGPLFLQGKAEFGATYPTPVKWCSEPKKIAKKGSVLISVRAPVGDVNIARDRYCIGRGLAAIDGGMSLDNWFLFYLLVYAKQRLEDRGTGSTFKSINKGVLQSFPIPLPPLPEQRRIAHVLNTIQRAIAAQDDVIAAARETKRSLMQRLFTYGPGAEPAPTKETEIGEIPAHWEIARFEDLCAFLQYGTSKRCDRDSSGMPVLRIPNVVEGKIDIGDMKFIRLPEKSATRLKLEIGDLLFVRTNGRREYTGRCAVFDGEPRESLFASYLIRARLKPQTLSPQYVQIYTMTSMGKAYLSGRATGAADGKYNINQQTIKSVLIPVPPPSERTEIVEAVHTCDDKIAAEEQRKAALQALFKPMLQQLMTGQVRVPESMEV